MGKAARWLKAFFGIKTSANNQSHKHSNSSGVDGERTRSSFGRDRMLGCYGGGICNNPETIPPNISPSEAEWIKYNYYNNNNNSAAGAHNNNNKRSSGEYYSTSSSSTEKEKEKEKEKAAMEENKHAIAVAAATAAAADAAVAAAQAAAAVVRLTSHGRCSTTTTTTTNRFTTSHKYYWDAAAVKIQTTFRGYLARKALRALRALVKLQALVRGYLVRKQATAKFHGMQALIRAQSTIRSKRLPPHMMTTNNSSSNPSNIQHQKDYYFPPATSRPSRRSMDIYDDTRSSNLSMPNSSSSRRLSLSAASFDTKNIINPLPIPDSEYYDIPPKVVQIDPGRPKSGSRRSTTTSYSELGEDPSSYQSLYYPPPRLSTCHHCSHQQDDDDDDYIRPFSATAQTTPRFIYPPATPSRTNSVCGDNSDNNHFGPYYYYPNYMASTKSFKAKSRSQSVPKQRPADILSTKKRLSAVDYELDSSSTNSIGFYGVRMQRSSSHATTTTNNNNREVSLDFNNNAVSYR